MKTRLLIILALGFSSSFSFIPHNAYACSCVSYPDYLQTLMESRSSFQGTVTKIIADGNHEKVYFDITFPQKGIPNTNEYVVEQLTLSTCSVNYKIGETYQVFTHNDNGIIGTTGMCDTKQITGFDEYSHEDENGRIEHFREYYNIFTQYSFTTIILLMTISVAVVSFFVWRIRK